MSRLYNPNVTQPSRNAHSSCDDTKQDLGGTMVNKGLDLISIACEQALHLPLIQGLSKSHAREARERRHENETARLHVSRGARRSPILLPASCYDIF